MGKKGKRKPKKKNSNIWHCPNSSNPNPNTQEQCASCGQLQPITVKSKALIQTLGPRTTASILGRIVPGAVANKTSAGSIDCIAGQSQNRSTNKYNIQNCTTGWYGSCCCWYKGHHNTRIQLFLEFHKVVQFDAPVLPHS